MLGDHDLLVVANRLPVDRVDGPADGPQWQRSPGGLVSALAPVMRSAEGVWIGWSGAPDDAPEPFDHDGVHIVSVPLSADEIEQYYEGFSNASLWPLYHDVIATPVYHRSWWDSYVEINQRFADVAAKQAARSATVWVHDYQLQLVPAMLREQRPDLRIGFFNHIPFPPHELFAQLPWRRHVIRGLLGADLVGFQRQGDTNNFLRVCRRISALSSRKQQVRVPIAVHEANDSPRHHPGDRLVRAAAFPISIDSSALNRLAQQPAVMARTRQIRADLGHPKIILMGIDRLDYTKGILHRLKAFEELLDDGRLAPEDAVLVQVATPSRERVEQYRVLRQDVEVTVGRINGDYGRIGQPVVHYLHHSYDQQEMAALYLAADVMLVTALRDGMNLVAKEYVAARHDERGALVLSEFTGAADEMGHAYLVNPHDIDGLKDIIVRAVGAPEREKTRRMRALRRRVLEHDVARWASSFLQALEEAPQPQE